MCGHVGIAGKLEYKDEAVFKRLLIYDYWRGPDSTGAAFVRNNGEIKIAKLASNPIDLFDMTAFKGGLSGTNSRVFMGHNRLATKGVVNNVNAHPYQFGHITGCHNGTLTPASWASLEKALDEKFDVDSQAVIASIAAFGIEATVKEMDGAWALVWFDSQQGTLNFLRNKERPFWYGYNKACDKVFWSSEYEFIGWALRGTDYEMYKEAKTGYCYWATEEDTLYSYNLEDLRQGGGKRPKPKAKVIKGKEPAPVKSVTPFTPTERRTTSPSTETNPSTTTFPSRSRPRPDTWELEGTKDSPFAGFIREDVFKENYKMCDFCHEPTHWGKVGYTVYERDEICLCTNCSTGDPTANRIYTTTVLSLQ